MLELQIMCHFQQESQPKCQDHSQMPTLQCSVCATSSHSNYSKREKGNFKKHTSLSIEICKVLEIRLYTDDIQLKKIKAICFNFIHICSQETKKQKVFLQCTVPSYKIQIDFAKQKFILNVISQFKKHFKCRPNLS